MADNLKITKEDLKKLIDKTHIVGDILLKEYSVKKQKNGDDYIAGTLCSEQDIQFKVWGSNKTLVDTFKKTNLQGKVITIDGEGNLYNNTISIIVNDIGLDGITLTPDDFIVSKYDIQAYANALKSIIQATVSDKAYNLALKILFDNEEVFNKFSVGYAASSHHDNCKGGLLAHTYKVVRLMAFSLEQYPDVMLGNSENITPADRKDVLLLGSLLHDIGKINEMVMGVYTPVAVVKHQYLGIEILNQFRDDIINAYGEQWWYDLCSILLQHHGEWGEPPKSIDAQLVHEIDKLESDFTLIGSMITSNLEADSIYYGDKYLNILK